MRTSRKLASVLLAACMVGGTTSVAVAQPSTTAASEDTAQLREFLSTWEVPAETQDELIGDFEAGETWDSYTPGAESVSTEMIDASTEVATYADGSVAVTYSEKPEAPILASVGGASARNISQCAVASGSGYSNYTNCLVGTNTGVISINFRADYQFIQGRPGKISRVDNPSLTVFGGSYVNRDFGIKKAASDANGPARARLAYDITLTQDAVTRTAWVELYVFQTRASSDFSF